MYRSPLSLGVVLCLASSVFGQGFTIQISGDSGFNLGLGDGTPLILTPAPGWMPTSPEKLVSMPRVANDLELLPTQRKELEIVIADLRKDFQAQREEYAELLRRESDPDRRERLQKELKGLGDDFKSQLRKKIGDVLLPFQRERLEQIVAQTKLNNNGSSALQSSEFAELLQLSDEQIKQLQERQRAMQEKLQEEIRELRRTRQREVIESVLSKGQFETLRKLVGDDLAPQEKKKD